MNKKFLPLYDKLYWIITVPTVVLMLALTVVGTFNLTTLLLFIAMDIFVGYFLVSPLFAYVELREESVFIKYGLFLKKEIPYDRIRATEKVRRWYSDSMMSLKNSLEHVNIKYNAFDVTSVSVNDNDEFIALLTERCKKVSVNPQHCKP